MTTYYEYPNGMVGSTSDDDWLPEGVTTISQVDFDAAVAQFAQDAAASWEQATTDKFAALREAGLPEAAVRILVPTYTGPDIPPPATTVTPDSVKADLVAHAAMSAGQGHG